MRLNIARTFPLMLFALFLLVEHREAAATVGPPDLVVSALAAPATGGAGSTITVTDTTRNQTGTGPAAPSVTRFYLSSNSTWDAGDVPIGFRGVLDLAPGVSSPGSTVLTIPAGYTAGTSYVIAKADADGALSETNEGNNTRSDSIVIGPDLIVSALSAPATSGVGLPIAVTDTTKNKGGGTAAVFATAFYLSANSTLGAGDVLLGSRTLTAGLSPNASSSDSTTLTIPASTAPASYYLIAKADDGGAAAETIETNNTRAVLIRISPDLQVSTLSAPTSAAPGAGISVSDTTRNAGQGTAGASTTRFYLSLNTTFEPTTDTPLGFRNVSLLTTGSTASGSTPVTIPAGTTSGTWYILARADADNAVAESQEANNLTYRAITVTAGADTTAPSVPTGLTASAVSCSQNTLAWAASTDNASGSGLKGYNIYKNGAFLKQVLAPATSTSDSGLAASTAFSYTVSAFDHANNQSAQSAAATATTPACSVTQAVWADAFGNTQEDRGRSVAIDPFGNTVMTGHFRQTVDFGGGLLTAKIYCLLDMCLPGYPSDIFLAKSTPAGVHLWSKRIGGHGDDSGSAVAVDSLGDVLVTGRVGPNVDFGGGELPALSGFDIFVAKYSGLDGSYRWARRLGSASNDIDSYAIAVDHLGDVVITGQFLGTVDFGNGPLTSAGGWDIFVAKYSGIDGSALWSKRLGGAQENVGLGVAVDSLGNVVVTGYFYGVVDFGGSVPFTSAGFYPDIFLAKYRAFDGAYLWANQIGGTAYDRGNAVAVDSGDNILLTGAFTGTVNFGGPGSLSSAHTAAGDAFVAKYTSSGGYLWAQRFGGISGVFTGTSGTALVVDASDNVAVTGPFQITVDFGNGPLVSAGSSDIFVLKLPPTGGTPLWSKRFGGPASTNGDYERSLGLAAGLDSSTVVTGYFIGTVSFGVDTFTSAGSSDIFLLHIVPE